MKCLSIRQPWAWLLVNGHKDIENRSWKTKFRGPLVIHAGKVLDRDGLRWVREHFPDIKLPSEFNLGGLVGVVTLRDVVQSSTSPWFFGPVGLVVDGGYPIPFVPQRGQLGLFDLDIPFHYLRRHS